MRKMLFATIVVLLSACSQAPRKKASASDMYSDPGKQAAWNEEGKAAIAAKLKDPESAQFRNVQFHMARGTPVTCGEVNAKNGFGGYSGYERFIAAGSALTVLESEMAAGEMEKTWQQLCRA